MRNKRIYGRDSRHRIAHQYIINFKPGTSQEEQDRIIQKVKGQRRRRYGKGFERFAPITVDDDMVEQLLENDAVESIDQEVIAKDPAIQEEISWGSFASSALNFWEAGYTGKNVLVALIDTGVNPHVDLPNLIGSWDVGLGNTGIGDVNPSSSGHGTKSAGVIGARNNNMGIRGVAYECNMFSICAYYQEPDDSTHSYTTTGRIVDALVYAYNMNPRPSVVLVNAQLSNGTTSLRAAVDNLVNAGVAVIAAAGNFASDYNDVAYPGSYSNVISVGAGTLNRNNLAIDRASYSQFGPSLDVTGYTGQLGTHKNGTGYADYTGTSCASPFVTGIMALLKQAYPAYTVTQLYNKLKEGLVPKTTDVPYEFGGGLVNLPAKLLPSPPTYPLVSSTTTENFESSNFKLNLTGDWSIGMDGTRNVLNSGALDKEQSAVETLKFRLPTTAMNAKLEFDYRIVSSSTLNRLYVYLNGYPVFYDAGNMTAYKRASISLPAGLSHRVDIVFRTESTVNGGSANIANMTVSMVASTVVTETFESSTLTIPFTGDWVRTTTSPQAGSYCYRSSAITHSQTSATSFNVTAPSGGTLEFWHRTDCEKTYDKLTVKAGSTTIVTNSGTGGTWMKETYTLSSGTTEITFVYSKDGSVNGGADAAYIDNVTVQGANISVSPGTSAGTPGDSISNSITLTGTSISGSFMAGKSVYYKYVAPSTGTFSFSTVSSSDLKMDLLNSSGTLLKSDDDSGGSYQPKIDYALTSGTTYFIRVYAYSSSVAASFTLNVTLPTPQGGSIDNPLILSGTSANGAFEAGKAVFYKYTAPSTGSFTFTTTSSSDLKMDLLNASGTVLKTDDDSGGNRQPLITYSLTSGTVYYVKVYAYSSSVAASFTLTVTPPAAGSPPGAATISVASKTSNSVTLNLTASNATSFNVYRSSSASGTYSLVASGVASPYTSTGLSSNTSYYYKTEGVNNYGTGSISSYVQVTTNAAGSPPGTPTLTVGSETKNSLTLTYSATGATSYDIYRGSTKIVSDRSTTSYTDTGLTAETTYSYYVVAKNAYGTTSSSTRSGTTLPDGTPGDSINNPITFTGSSINGSFEAGKSVYYKFVAPQGGTWSFTTSSKSDLIMDLLDDRGNLLKSDDDSGGSLQPKIDYNLSRAATYYIRVYAYSKSVAATFTLTAR